MKLKTRNKIRIRLQLTTSGGRGCGGGDDHLGGDYHRTDHGGGGGRGHAINSAGTHWKGLGPRARKVPRHNSIRTY